MKRIVLLVVLLAIVASATVAVAIADGPIIWKAHCPRWHDVQLVPDKAGNGVHVLCVMQAMEVTPAQDD